MNRFNTRILYFYKKLQTWMDRFCVVTIVSSINKEIQDKSIQQKSNIVILL